MSPTYVYRCPKCSETIEQFKPLAESSAEVMCGDCLEPMEKIFQQVAAHFKGGGWGSSK